MIRPHDISLRTAARRPSRRESYPGTGVLFGVLHLLLLLVLAFSATGQEPSQSTEAQPEAAEAAENAAAATGSQESESKDEAQEEKAAAGEEGAEEKAAGEEAAEEEKDWLVDEKGLYYEIFTLPKVKGTYSRPSEGFARFPGGATYEVLEESDDTFWLKRYDPDQFNLRLPKKKEEPEEMEYEHSVEISLERVDRVALEPYDQGLPTSGQWRNGFDLADMNGDGHLDIVFGPARKATPRPTIFLGDGKGTWRRWTEARFPPSSYDYGDAIAADWNDDGHMDLAFGIHLRGILVLIGDGEGGFETWSEGIALDRPGEGQLDAFSSRALAAADWDGDGRTDLLAYGEGPKRARGRTGGIVQTSRGLRVFLNQGDGSWRTYQLSPGAQQNFGDDFALIDLDRDGQTDVVTGSARVGSRAVALYFDTPLVASLAVFEPIRPRGLVDAIEAADIDEDGATDLVITQRFRKDGLWHSGVDVLLRRDEIWERRTVFQLDQREPIRALAVGDVDADGHLDLATIDDWGVLRLFLGDGDGGFVAETSPESPRPIRGCQGYDVALRNLDDRPGDEIVAAYAGETQGMEALTGTSHPGCPGEGSMKAWSPVPKPAPEGPEGD